jgi:hypothetical protein
MRLTDRGSRGEDVTIAQCSRPLVLRQVTAFTGQSSRNDIQGQRTAADSGQREEHHLNQTYTLLDVVNGIWKQEYEATEPILVLLVDISTVACKILNLLQKHG